MEIKMETIRRAILKYHGGLKEATDSQVMTVWGSLTEETKKQYLQNMKERKDKKDADRDKA